MDDLVAHVGNNCNSEWRRQVRALMNRLKKSLTCPGGLQDNGGGSDKPPKPTAGVCEGVPGALDDNPPNRYRRGAKGNKKLSKLFRKKGKEGKKKKNKTKGDSSDGYGDSSGGNSNGYGDTNDGSVGGYGGNTADPFIWGEWGKWGKCCADCGNGQESRKRICYEDMGYGYFETGDSACETNIGGSHQESRNCYGTSCTTRPPTTTPKPSAWGPWGKWSICSRTCDGGQTSRSRNCNYNSNYDECKGKSRETKACNVKACPTSTTTTTSTPAPPSEWGRWSAWSQCSRTCGGGKSVRSRQCNYNMYDEPCYGKAGCHESITVHDIKLSHSKLSHFLPFFVLL